MNKQEKEFQILQAQLTDVIDYDVVTNIAIGVANTSLSVEQKCEVLRSILKTSNTNKIINQF